MSKRKAGPVPYKRKTKGVGALMRYGAWCDWDKDRKEPIAPDWDTWKSNGQIRRRFSENYLCEICEQPCYMDQILQRAICAWCMLGSANVDDDMIRAAVDEEIAAEEAARTIREGNERYYAAHPEQRPKPKPEKPKPKRKRRKRTTKRKEANNGQDTTRPAP